MSESFIGTVQKQKRVAIKHEIYDLLKLKEGDRVRIIIEKIKR